ncbi:MAG TPA: pectinesterase family protein [Tepidisphaeraceae bacterium]|nr:pectinesterase family protein [Tepidisphaeraceae bacterium]
MCACVCAVSAVILVNTQARGANYYVDPSYAGTNGAPYGTYTAAYNSVAAALGSSGVPSGASATNPNFIYFAPGTYNVGTSSLSYSKSNVDLVGLTGNANDVVITSTLDSSYNPGSGAIGTTGSSTLQLKGNNVTAANITFANSTDTPYIVNVTHSAVSPTGSYTGNNSQTSTGPAVALLLQGDEQAFQNCNFLGYQDTLYTKGGRSFFNNCTVSGDDDFIFANGTSVFNNCTINIDGDHSGGAVTAASTDKRTSNGLVFVNSTITGNSVHGNSIIDANNAANINGPNAASMYLGRPWGWTQAGGDASTVYINDKITPAIKPVGWLNWDTTELNSPTKNNGDLTQDARFAEYNSMNLDGSPMDVSQRVAWSHQLTADQAAAYTVADIFAVESGYAWYGLGYPAGDASNPGTGSADPTDPSYSWPAYWGDRNAENETGNDTVAGTVGTPPIPRNPSAYSDPSWTLGGNWDPYAQLALVPEPATASLLGGVLLAALHRRQRKAS